MALTQQQILEARKRLGIPEAGLEPSNNQLTNSVGRRKQLAAEYDAKQTTPSGFLGETREDAKQTAGAISSTIDRTKQKLQAVDVAQAKGEQGKLASFGQKLGLVAGGISSGISDIVTGLVKSVLPETKERASKEKIKQIASDITNATIAKHERMKIEEPEKAAQVQGLIDEYQNSSEKTKREIDSLLGVTSLATDLAGFGIGKKTAETVIEQGTKIASEITERAARTGADLLESGSKLLPSLQSTKEAAKGVIQTGTELAQRIPRGINRLRESGQEAAARAAKIAESKPAVANAIKLNLDNRIINTVTEADEATRKAYKDVVNIAEEAPKKIGAKRQPSIVSGNLAVKQYDLINKQKKNIGQQIGETVKTLSKVTTENVDDGFSEMASILSNQGVQVRRSKKGLALDFSGSKYTPAQRAKIKELFNLALEGGEKLSPKQIYAKDQLFSNLQREARMEGVSDIIVETPDGAKNLFSVFRDIYSKKLEQIVPEIKPLNKQYRELALITDDIEDSIFKTPNFNAIKYTDQAEFAKVNLRRIFGEAQSSPAFEAVANQMDALARKLGYADASPKDIAEFAQELRKLYPESIPKTGFQGGIKVGIGDIVEKAFNVGTPNLADQRKALIELLNSL